MIKPSRPKIRYFGLDGELPMVNGCSGLNSNKNLIEMGTSNLLKKYRWITGRKMMFSTNIVFPKKG